MRYKQYKFKFYLNARHAIYTNGILGDIHPHTWEITCHVVKDQDDFIQFKDILLKIEKYMEVYQDQVINEIAPFDILNPTLENMSEFFRNQFQDILNESGWIFLMMEMSETPTSSIVINMTDDSSLGQSQIINSVTDQILARVKIAGKL